MKVSSFVVGLIFPELGKHSLEDFLNIIDKQKNKINLLVFPEAFETIIPTSKHVAPELITSDGNVQSLINKYISIAKKYEIAIIVGFQIDYKNQLISGAKNDQYSAYLSPQEECYIYHKHSSSKFNAFFDSNWSIENNFKMFTLDWINLGISICHDSYISLIPRLLRKKGVNLWVNISYQNVRSKIWEAVHLTRSVENNFISICTLHRNSKKSNPQKEPYAFSPEGKIRLRDIETNKYIDELPEDRRTGKIYIFDVKESEVLPVEQPKESALSNKADKITIIQKENNIFEIMEDKNTFLIKEITLDDYFKPEILWKVTLKHVNKTTIFIVRVQSGQVWDENKNYVLKTIKGRIIEFSTAFIFIENHENILLCAYRSSSYKDLRIFYPNAFPIVIDKRYLKGISSICTISLNDPRIDNQSLYYERIQKIISNIVFH